MNKLSQLQSFMVCLNQKVLVKTMMLSGVFRGVVFKTLFATLEKSRTPIGGSTKLVYFVTSQIVEAGPLLRKQRHASGGQLQRPTLGIPLLKEEAACPAALLRKKTSENSSGTRIEKQLHQCTVDTPSGSPSPKAPSVVLSTGRDKNAVDYLPSPVFYVSKKGRQPLASIQKCLLLPETVGFVPWRNTDILLTTARIVLGRRQESFPTFLSIFFLLLYQRHCHFSLNKRV